MSSENSSPSVAAWTRDWAAKSGVVCWFSDSTESTNAVAKADLGAVDSSPLAPRLYISSHQTAGRGRGTNTWINATGGGALLSSWSFHMPQAPQPVFSPLTGLAVYNAAMKVWPTLKWSLKAPNDLYLDDRKVAGLLIETVESGSERRTIVGLGMNVLAAPGDVETAICLSDSLDESCPVTPETWAKFLQALMVNFMATLPKGQKGEIADADAKALADALNRFPHLEEKIVKVGKRCELHTPTKIIDWHTL